MMRFLWGCAAGLMLLFGTGCGVSDWAKRETVWQALHAADMSQTLQAVSNCNSGGTRGESNRILGDCPSHAKTYRYFGITAVGHYMIADALPEDAARGFQWGTSIYVLSAVKHNWELGLYFTW